jgi:N-acetyl-anhydromuramyl-L-alanine amidase AmpD
MKHHKFMGLAWLIILMLVGSAFADTQPPDTNHTSQEEFLLLDIEKLDEVMGMTKIDENGEELTYRLRRLDDVVDQVTRHTNDDHHGHGEDYHLWREHLRKPHPTVETFKYFFAQASQEFGVPVEILEAIGHVESNWTQIGPSIDRGWGVMHLVQNNYADTLGEAATLLDIEPQILQDDARQNIRGAAALIAHYAGEQRHSFTQLEDWFEAVKQFTGLINEELREMQALRYYEVIKTGAESQTLWGETITLTSHSNISLTPDRVNRVRTRRNTRSTDYKPAVSNLTSCNYTSRSNRTIDTWVNHWIGEGTYAGAISWFHNCSAQASAHFIVRASDGEITQLVQVKDIAWHAGVWNYNQRSIGVEHEVTVSNPSGWNTTWTTSMLKASAKMARYFADKYSIPKTRSTTPGILGHNEIKSTTCPGTLPWDEWMKYFNGGSDIKLYSAVTINPYPIVQNSPLTIEVRIANYGSENFVGNFAAALHTTSGQFIHDIERKDNQQLNAGMQAKYTFYKSNISSDPGNYQIQMKYESPTAGIAWDVIPEDAYTNPRNVQIVKGDPPSSSGNYFWHGNGSLISYHGRLIPSYAGEDWPYGITQDVVQLHALSGNPVGFFQWQVNENSCKKLKLEANLPYSQNEVDITMGPWSNRNDDITFSKVKLPFVLGESNTGYRFDMDNGKWYVVKVALRKGLSQNVKLYAYCTYDTPTSAYYQRGGGDSVVMASGYQWHGNASVISHIFRNLYSQRNYNLNPDWPYGAFQDVVNVHPSSAKPMVFFQWQRDSICPRLTLDSDLSSYEKQVDIHVKSWAASPDAAMVYRNKTLPYTIDDNNSNGSWSVIQIKFKNPVSKTGRVTAKCPGT